MPNLIAVILDVVEGDDYVITRTVTGVPAGDTIATAWLTMKANVNDADPGLFSKKVTSVDSPGTGQVTDTGADETGALRFDLVPADTLLPTPGVAAVYDMQIKTTNGQIYTVEKGTFTTIQQVTDASV